MEKAVAHLADLRLAEIPVPWSPGENLKPRSAEYSMETQKYAFPVSMRSCFQDPLLDVMNFLNEIVLEFPQGISFAPGRPPSGLFDVENALAAIRDFLGTSTSSTLDTTLQ